MSADDNIKMIEKTLSQIAEMKKAVNDTISRLGDVDSEKALEMLVKMRDLTDLAAIEINEFSHEHTDEEAIEFAIGVNATLIRNINELWPA